MEKIERLKCGIKEIDTMMGGGFEPQTINLLVGKGGSGKSIFAMHYIMEGISQGEHGLFISFEEKKKDFYLNMAALGWDLAKAEEAGSFVFLEYSPEKVKTMLEEGGGVIESIVIKNEIKRIAVDSVTSFLLMFEEEIKRREGAAALFDIIRSWGCTPILTLDEDPEEPKGLMKSVESEVDGVVCFYYLRQGETRIRAVEVLKMRGTKHSSDTIEFEIGEKGIKVGKKFNIEKALRGGSA